MESRDVLESMQRLWRRIGEGSDDGSASARIEAAAAETELAINSHIDRLTRLKETIQTWWPIIAGGLLAIAIGVVFVVLRELHISEGRAKALDERAEALDQVRKVRGFTAAALLVGDAVHTLRRLNPYVRGDATPTQADKALIVAYGLQGWRRGRDERNWVDGTLELVIWRTIILAIESVHTPNLFKEWEQAGQTHPQAFLLNKKLIRDVPQVSAGCPIFFFEVDCPPKARVSMPFMLEQALVCLLQNAIIASLHQEGYYLPITITYDKASDTVAVSNQGPRLSLVLCAVLNESRSVDEFEKRIDGLLRGPAEHRPGIGLVEAYCVAKQCYGGLRIEEDEPKASIRLHSK